MNECDPTSEKSVGFNMRSLSPVEASAAVRSFGCVI